MSTYKIVFTLNCDTVLNEIPTFDALLSFAYAKYILTTKEGRDYYLKQTTSEYFKSLPILDFIPQRLSIPADEQIDFSTLPISQHKDGYFLATTGLVVGEDLETRQYYKRFDSLNTDLIKLKGKRIIKTNKSTFKNEIKIIGVKYINTITFYFNSPSINLIKKLLTYLPSIGKKGSLGYGFIESSHIETSDFKFNSIYRPIPLRLLPEIPEGAIRYCGWKPPYWMPDNMEACAVPK